MATPVSEKRMTDDTDSIQAMRNLREALWSTQSLRDSVETRAAALLACLIVELSSADDEAQGRLIELIQYALRNRELVDEARCRPRLLTAPNTSPGTLH
jgi:hypothetical protein